MSERIRKGPLGLDCRPDHTPRLPASGREFSVAQAQGSCPSSFTDRTRLIARRRSGRAPAAPCARHVLCILGLALARLGSAERAAWTPSQAPGGSPREPVGPPSRTAAILKCHPDPPKVQGACCAAGAASPRESWGRRFEDQIGSAPESPFRDQRDLDGFFADS